MIDRFRHNEGADQYELFEKEKSQPWALYIAVASVVAVLALLGATCADSVTMMIDGLACDTPEQVRSVQKQINHPGCA